MTNLSKDLYDHSEERCRQYVTNDYARITIKMDQSSYMRRTQKVALSFSDKLGIMGGILCLFLGFSFVSLFEFGYWVGVTLVKYFKSSVEPDEDDPIKKLRNEFKEEIGKLNKENDSLKIEMAKLKEKSANEEEQEKPKKSCEAIIINEIEKS